MRPVLLAACVLAAACGKTSTTAHECSDVWPPISLLSITPSPGTPLPAGESATVQATFSYDTCQTSHVYATVQDQDQRPVSTGGADPPRVDLPIGRGTATLSATFVVPASGLNVSLEARYQVVGTRAFGPSAFGAIYPIGYEQGHEKGGPPPGDPPRTVPERSGP